MNLEARSPSPPTRMSCARVEYRDAYETLTVLFGDVRDSDFDELIDDLYVTFDHAQAGALTELHALGPMHGRPLAWRRVIEALLGARLACAISGIVSAGRDFTGPLPLGGSAEAGIVDAVRATTHQSLCLRLGLPAPKRREPTGSPVLRDSLPGVLGLAIPANRLGSSSATSNHASILLPDLVNDAWRIHHHGEAWLEGTHLRLRFEVIGEDAPSELAVLVASPPSAEFVLSGNADLTFLEGAFDYGHILDDEDLANMVVHLSHDHADAMRSRRCGRG